MKNHPPRFLPMTIEEGAKLGIDQFDIILVTGDAYVDHPSFGSALIGRLLWDSGYSVGIIARPDWHNPDDFSVLGEPRLFFGISSGAVDSMVNNYTPALKRRNEDVYGPGGHPGRPDRATVVYCEKVHARFPDTPILIGGIEASLRRFAHYDYWSDSVRRSILADAPAHILAFGMAEHQVVETARQLSEGTDIRQIRNIHGTVYKMAVSEWRSSEKEGMVVLPSYSEVAGDKLAYAKAFSVHYREQDPIRGRKVVQAHPKTVIIQNPPSRPLTPGELDSLYELPFTRQAHPSYHEPVPALEPVRFSITSHRGCFGACSFCALTHHQGRIIQSRSVGSLVREVERMVKMPGYYGIIQDIGGPTANMYGASCPSWSGKGTCIDRNCAECRSLETAHEVQVAMLRRIRAIPGVKKVFISSGIRYDLLEKEANSYLGEVVRHHVSGHLKVAPEHISPHVTRLMNKPPKESFEKFCENFRELTHQAGKEQYILPYFMSGHPGCRVEDMIELACYQKEKGLYTEQVQDFTPTPMSCSTCMFYTGLNPFTLEPVYVPRGQEKIVQRALLHYKDMTKYPVVEGALRDAGRSDLIGPGKGCLIPARKERKNRR